MYLMVPKSCLCVQHACVCARERGCVHVHVHAWTCAPTFLSGCARVCDVYFYGQGIMKPWKYQEEKENGLLCQGRPTLLFLRFFFFFWIWPWAVDSRSIGLVLLFGLGVCLLDMILISLCSSSYGLMERSDDSNFIKESLSFSDRAYCS